MLPVTWTSNSRRSAIKRSAGTGTRQADDSCRHARDEVPFGMCRLEAGLSRSLLDRPLRPHKLGRRRLRVGTSHTPQRWKSITASWDCIVDLAPLHVPVAEIRTWLLRHHVPSVRASSRVGSSATSGPQARCALQASPIKLWGMDARIGSAARRTRRSEASAASSRENCSSRTATIRRCSSTGASGTGAGRAHRLGFARAWALPVTKRTPGV